MKITPKPPRLCQNANYRTGFGYMAANFQLAGRRWAVDPQRMGRKPGFSRRNSYPFYSRREAMGIEAACCFGTICDRESHIVAEGLMLKTCSYERFPRSSWQHEEPRSTLQSICSIPLPRRAHACKVTR